MTLQLINPEDLPVPSTYTHVVVATGTRMVFIAGQEPEDVHGNLVGPGDLAAQARQVYANLGRALDRRRRPPRSGRQDHDLRRSPPARAPAGHRAGQKHLFGEHKPADTVVGVETLAGPGYLIEVDAIAVTDR